MAIIFTPLGDSYLKKTQTEPDSGVLKGKDLTGTFPSWFPGNEDSFIAETHCPRISSIINDKQAVRPYQKSSSRDFLSLVSPKAKVEVGVGSSELGRLG